jgi:hypothetical protein
VMDSLRNPEALMPDEAATAAIRQHIDRYNRERAVTERQCRTHAVPLMSVYGIIAAIVLVILVQASANGQAWGAFIALAAGGGIWLWRQLWKPLRDHQLALRHRLFPQIFGFIDQVEYASGIEPHFLVDLRQLQLVRFTRTRCDDLIAGVHEGMEFALLETELVTGSGKSEQITFKGLIFRFDLERPFEGVLIANQRLSWWQRSMADLWSSTSLRELSSGNLRLDESHVFLSNDPAAAMPIIAGPLTSVLTWLGDTWREGDVRIALSREHGYLLLPSKRNYFAFPPARQDINYEADIKPLVREMVRLLAIAHVARRAA